jgi:hypothetical protein
MKGESDQVSGISGISGFPTTTVTTPNQLAVGEPKYLQKCTAFEGNKNLTTYGIRLPKASAESTSCPFPPL